MLNELQNGKLDWDVYTSGLEHFPIATVDFVLKKGNSFLLIKRDGGAYSGDWFVAGGRQFRGETKNEALLRIAQRELGVREQDIREIIFSHTQDVFNHASTTPAGDLPAWHSIMQFHIVKVNEDFDPVLDDTSSDCMWISTIDTLPVPEPVKRALYLSGLISKNK